MAVVEVLPEALADLDALPTMEQEAMERALLKLRLFGEALGYPHSSQIRELRCGSYGPAKGARLGGRSTSASRMAQSSWRRSGQRRSIIRVDFVGRSVPPWID